MIKNKVKTSPLPPKIITELLALAIRQNQSGGSMGEGGVEFGKVKSKTLSSFTEDI